jgi:hypothetical protein
MKAFGVQDANNRIKGPSFQSQDSTELQAITRPGHSAQSPPVPCVLFAGILSERGTMAAGRASALTFSNIINRQYGNSLFHVLLCFSLGRPLSDSLLRCNSTTQTVCPIVRHRNRTNAGNRVQAHYAPSHSCHSLPHRFHSARA